MASFVGLLLLLSLTGGATSTTTTTYNEPKPQHRFWKHHLENKSLLVNGFNQWNNMENCLAETVTPDIRQQLSIPSPNASVDLKLQEQGQTFFVAIQHAMTPVQAQAVQALAACIRQHVPNLYNPARALYLEFGLDEDDNFGGNTPTVLNPLMSIFLPEVVEVVYRALEQAYDEAEWHVLTDKEEILLQNQPTHTSSLVVEHPHPQPRACGIRVAEHLSYDNFRSLGDHDDGYGGTAYTVNFALSSPDDYQGGRVFLISNHDKNQKWYYKPEKYTVMAFLGGEYLHGVEDITGGHREVFSTEFWRFPDAPFGNTLAETQPESMKAYMYMCEVAGKDPCQVSFEDAVAFASALQHEEEGEYGEEEFYDEEEDYDNDEEEEDYDYDEEEDYYDDEEEENEGYQNTDTFQSATTVDFVSNPVKPLEITPLRWIDGEGRVSKYAFRAGLPQTLTQKVREYCDKMGITDEFRRLLVEGQASPPDSQKDIKLNGFNWYILRPGRNWHSNMHWIGPGDADAYRDMLEVLSAGGFDSFLDLLGTTFDLDGIAVYHVGFMAVSKCGTGFRHSDFTETRGKGWHVIFPLLSANDTGPDLNIFSADGTPGGYKYEDGIACVIGDDVEHATATLDYSDTKEMRITASIYLADINEDNAESIADEYSNYEFPEGDPKWLLAQAGNHWSKTDRSRRLPSKSSPSTTNEPPVCNAETSPDDCVAKE